MGARERIERHRSIGGAADLVRVEVLVPAARKNLILSHASRLREQHRAKKQKTVAAVAEALALYGIRITENIDLDRVHEPANRARIVAQALMERGDARAYAIGRNLLAMTKE